MTEELEYVSQSPPEVANSPAPGPTRSDRARAFVEVILCSDYPTQILVSGALVLVGMNPMNGDGSLNISFVVALSIIDSFLLIGIILVFMRAHGDNPRSIIFGDRPLTTEIAAGLWLIPVVFLAAALMLGLILQFAPGLRTVPENPLKSLMQSPAQAALFAVVVLVAGGIREEVQRAFLMNRFERWLGGSSVGIVVTSAAFGAGHILQGLDATIATALLGAIWATVYVRRRSAVAPMVSHAGFDLIQLVNVVAFGA